MRLRGEWPQAEQLVRLACDELRDFGALAMAASGLYELGEIRRRTGDLNGAEDAYCEALELGHECQPGLALLRLAQGDLASATAAITDALGDKESAGHAGLPRVRLLAAQVEIALAAGNFNRARDATAELQAIADRYGTTALQAEAATAHAALAHPTGASALSEARRAHRLWQDLAMPYEAARARLLVAAAQRAAGHDDAARLQLQAAAATFERLGALPALAGARRLLAGEETNITEAGAMPDAPAQDSRESGPANSRDPGEAPVLTPRERDVLTLVASGLTDRQIAERLVVSPHTIHRHLANIRTKLGQPTRAATVAHATRLGLL